MAEQQRPLGRYPMWGGRSPGEAFGARRQVDLRPRRYPANVKIRDVVGLMLALGGVGVLASGAAMVAGPGGVFCVLGVVMVGVGVWLGTGED